MADKTYTVAQVQKRLDKEPKKLDDAQRGHHGFNNIHKSTGATSNWAATPYVRGSRIAFTELHAVIARVQAEMPTIKW